MKFTIAAITFCFFKCITTPHYDDNFGFEKSYMCLDSGSTTIRGKFKVTDSTIIEYKPAYTKVYYWYNCDTAKH